MRVMELIILFFLSLISLRFLPNSTVIIGHDTGVTLDPWQNLVHIFRGWNPTINFGFDASGTKGFLLTKLPETIFTLITGSLHTGQQITVVFWFLILMLSMYLSLSLLFPNRNVVILRLWASTFWAFNFFTLQAWTIFERAKFSAMAALPICFAILVLTVSKQWSVLKGSLLFGFTLFVWNGGGSMPLFGGFLLMTLVTFLSSFHYKRALSFAILTSITTLLLNAYWIFPLGYSALHTYAGALAGQGGTEGILEWEAMFSGKASWPNLLRLSGIPGGWEHTSVFLATLGFVPFLLIVLGLLFWKKLDAYSYRHILMPLLVLLPIGLVFTAGTHPPFGFIYAWLIRNVPGFAIFRSSFFKFAPALWFPMIVLSGFFLNQLLKTKRVIVCVFIVAAIVAYHYPFVTGNMFSWNPPFSTRVTIPTHVTDMLTDIRLQVPQQSRILLLPRPDEEFHASGFTWGFWSLSVLPRYFGSHSFVATDKQAPAVVSDIYTALDHGDTDTFLTLTKRAGIGYVLWQGDYLSLDKNAHTKPTIDFPVCIDHNPWVLYQLPHSSKSFEYVASSLSILRSNNTSLTNLPEMFMVRNQPLFITENAPEQSVSALATTVGFEARCQLCTEADRMRFQNTKILLPPVRLRPNSPFYWWVKFREQRILKKAGSDSGKLLDAHLGFAMQRLAEGQEPAPHIEEIKHAFTKLDEFQKYQYAQKLLLYLPIRTYVEELIAPYLYISEPPTYRYLLPIAEEGTYTFSALPDGPSIPPTHLTPGVYRFETVGVVPRIIAFKTTKKSNGQKTPLKVTRDHAAKFSLTLPASETPYVVSLTEAFTPDWRLEGVSPIAHIPLDGFANGWIVKPEKEQTVTVEYFPYRIFRVGLWVSIMSLMGAILVLRHV